jgi:mannosyltransferase OCH1-like enzyme
MKITTIKRYLKRPQLLISLLMLIVIIVLLVGIFCLSTFNWRVHMSDIPKQISVHPFDDTTVNGIPLIIHQTWKTNEVPEKWKEPQESWTNQSVTYPLKRKYNEFVYMLWTDEMLDKFIKEQYPWFYQNL